MPGAGSTPERHADQGPRDLDATYELPAASMGAATIDAAGFEDDDGNATPAPPRSDAPDLARGVQLGRYVVLSKLGVGGMGVVYAAYDPELDRKLAIKLLRYQGAAQTRKGASRLQREAQALAKLDHPNVVSIHDVGTHQGRVFVAMDYLDGPNLRDWVTGRAWREVLDMYLRAGEGLAAAHAAGIVHRDFKPENVIVADARPRVLDFGLARATRAGIGDTQDSYSDMPALPVENARESQSLNQAITRAGAVLGTPAFMAPEQHLGDETGPATDQFAFAVALHEALYGEAPFAGATVAARAFAVTQGKVQPAPKRPAAPLWIRKLLLRALEVDPERRWPSMQALLAALRKDPAVRRRQWAVGLGGAALLGALAWMSTDASDAGGAPTCPDPSAALGDAWSQGRRQAVQQAFEGSPLPYAAKLASPTIEAFDDYAQRWQRLHADTCEATRVRHEQSETLMDRRMVCLAGARRHLEASTRELSAGEDMAVEHAAEFVASLPSLDRCEAAAVAKQKGDTYGSPPPAIAGQVESIEDALAVTLAHRTAGDIQRAETELAELLERADELEHPPLRAALCLARAETLEAVGKPRDAEKHVHCAMRYAEFARDDRRVAESRILAGLIIGDRLARTEEGYRWLDLAEASLARVDDGFETEALEARRLNNLALIHSVAGRYQDELEAKRAALVTLSAASSPNPVQVAAVHNNLSASLSQVGQHDEAIEHAQRAIDMWTEHLGPEHPKVAIGWASLGLAHDYAGQYAQALPKHERAIELLEASLGPDSPRVAEVLNNMAITAINLGDLERGTQAFERVVRLKTSALGEDHMEVASALGNLGSALRMSEDFERALEIQERARAILERVLEPEHPRLAGTLSGLANTYETLGRDAEALALRERVLAIETKAYGEFSPEVAIDLGNLAWSLMDAKKFKRARQLADRGATIVEQSKLKPDVEAFLRLVSARAALHSGAKRSAVQPQVEAALAVLGDLPAPTERKMAETIASLW